LMCSLCAKPSLASGFSWSCPRGPCTMWHTTRNDICEACFGHHVSAHARCESPSRQVSDVACSPIIEFPKQSPLLCRGGVSVAPWRRVKPLVAA
jgi:hypothetical protein